MFTLFLFILLAGIFQTIFEIQKEIVSKMVEPAAPFQLA